MTAPNIKTKKRIPFSFADHGPQVEELYKEGKSVSAIAKLMHRGTETIKNYLIQKNLYRGPENVIGKKRAIHFEGSVPEEHKPREEYYSTRHRIYVRFSGYWTDAKGNKVCRIYVKSNDLHFSAYCKPEELIQQQK